MMCQIRAWTFIEGIWSILTKLNENAPTLVTVEPTDLEMKILREQIDLKGLLRK
jgi:hypothetical protein